MDLMSLVPDKVVPPERNQRGPIIEHRCEVPSKRDVIKNLLKGDGLFSRFRQWIMKFFILSIKHPYTRHCLKSTAATNYEISRHIRSYPKMIHPFSLFRLFWEIFTTIFTIIALFIVPVLMAYYFDKHEYWFPITLFIDIIFLSDIFVTFATGHYDFETRVVILEPRIVAQNYLRSYFFLDLLTIIPVEVIDLIINQSGNTNWFSPIFNFIKIFRMRNVMSNCQNLKQTFQISLGKYKIIKMTIILAMAIHWSACLEYYVPKAVLTNKELPDTYNSWILSDIMKKKNTRIKKYIVCLQRATTSLVSSSHHLPVTTLEDMILNLVLAILGKIGFIYLLAQFVQLSAAVFWSKSNKDSKLLQQFREFIQYKELPSYTQKRLLAYCDYYNKTHFEREKYILSQVTPYLRQELILHRCKKLLETVPLLNHLPQPVVAKVAECIRPKIYLKNDEIVKVNTHGDTFFYIVSGTVAIYSNKGKEMCHLEDDSYFGETALVMENETRIASIYAVETCLMYILIRSDFLQAISTYPSLLNRLQKVALKRLELMILPGEASKEKILLPKSINISNIRGFPKFFSK